MKNLYYSLADEDMELDEVGKEDEEEEVEKDEEEDEEEEEEVV